MLVRSGGGKGEVGGCSDVTASIQLFNLNAELFLILQGNEGL
jgi:hypothetical protein